MCALYLHHATQILSVCVRGTKDMNSVKSDEINASVMSKNYSFILIKIYCVCISLLYRTQLQLCWIANKSYCILLKAIFFMRMPFSHCSVVLEVERIARNFKHVNLYFNCCAHCNTRNFHPDYMQFYYNPFMFGYIERS